MDHSARIEAIRTAKAIIASHGISFHLNKYGRNSLSNPVHEGDIGLLCEFYLDPTRDSWGSSNPSCSIRLNYVSTTNGNRLTEDGSMVLDQNLRITISASSSEMDLPTFQKREGMISLASMLCDMLYATLPNTVTSTIESASERKERLARESEQTIGNQIMLNIGPQALKGLRRGGSGRAIRLTEAYTSANGSWPAPGTYRFRLVLSTTRRGTPKDVANYTFKVHGDGVNSPPLVMAWRLNSDL